MKNLVKMLGRTCYIIGVTMLIAGGVFDVISVFYFIVAVAFIFIPWAAYIMKNYTKHSSLWLLFAAVVGNIAPNSLSLERKRNCNDKEN